MTNDKIAFVCAKAYKKFVKAQSTGSKKPIVVSRSSVVLEMFVGYSFSVYNGKKNPIVLIVSESMVGHKFGEFVPTRLFKGHSGKAADKKDAKKGGK